jgi:RNA polymerase sigma-70 factor (ECF subfamily)
LRSLFVEEQDKDTVCREMGISREYIRVLVHRAKKSFRERSAKVR